MENQPGKESLIATPPERRRILRAQMRSLAQQGRTCAACTGVCCTFVANSMKITPLEAQDLKRFLEAEGRWTPALFAQLRETVARYRLDLETGDGRRALRKTYTCPFYTPGPTGCSIHPDHKPYGCLAFNARRPGITEGGDCASDTDLLQQRETQFPQEAAMNQQLRHDWGLHADTAPIPVALLALVST